MFTKHKINKVSTSETAQCKVRIQGLLRAIVIQRDGGCFARFYSGMGECGPYRNDGQLILQYDHLNTRARNISYGDPRLGVCVCPNHHYHHHNNMRAVHPEVWERYMKNVKEFIGADRVRLLESVQADMKSYPMGLWDWTKVEIALKGELAERMVGSQHAERQGVNDSM